MFYNEIKKAVLWHLLGGVVFSLILFAVIFFVRYEASLQSTVKKFEIQKGNYQKMKQATVDMEKVMGQIDDMMPENYYSKGHRELMLMMIGEIKDNLGNAEVKIIDFKEEGGEISLPVEIKLPVEDYTIMTESIAYIQSFKFPYFLFEDIKIIREKSSDIICNIRGSVRMPRARLARPSGDRK
jgi:hypothetical protein